MQGQRQRETERLGTRRAGWGQEKRKKRVGLYNRLPYYFYCPSELPLSQAAWHTHPERLPSCRFMLGCTHRKESGPRRGEEGWPSHRLKHGKLHQAWSEATWCAPAMYHQRRRRRSILLLFLHPCKYYYLNMCIIIFCVNLVKKTHTNAHSPAPSVTRCQEQNPLAFIKIQIGGIEAWVTSGGVFSYCTLASSSEALALSVCWVEREVVVVINKEETGLNGTRRWWESGP